MKLFMCFGGADAVVDDEAAAAARHRDQRSRSRSFRGKFFSGKKGSKKSPLHESKRRDMDTYDVYAAFGPSTASSVASSVSLDLGYSSSSSSSARSSTASSSPSVSGELFPPAAKRRTSSNKGSSSPAAGAAVVVLCLLMVVFCGRVGKTLLTSMALYLFPQRWSARMARGVDGVGSLECDAGKETTARRKVVMDQGFLVRNRKK